MLKFNAQKIRGRFGPTVNLLFLIRIVFLFFSYGTNALDSPFSVLSLPFVPGSGIVEKIARRRFPFSCVLRGLAGRNHISEFYKA